ncbi:MAG TPA: metal-dependent transcriptional regulator [Bacteroidia bacterium]|jgi:DtxR family Mn-dependent transcriptional regulator
MNSFTEENYLKAIYKLLEGNHGPVTTNALAEALLTRAASVTDMLKKLSGKKLIHYRRYYGVSLTAAGRKVAVNVIRKHRLWELFLVEKLHFRWDEVHEIAEQLEHIISEELTYRLDRFLGYPKFDPHGDPIPDRNGRIVQPRVFLLSEMERKSYCVISGVADHSPAFLHFLDKTGLGPGDELKVEDIIEYDRSMQLVLGRKKKIHLSYEAAKNILVRKK